MTMEVDFTYAALALLTAVISGCLLQATGFPQWLYGKLPWGNKK